jgi:hypothetical protein
MLLACMHGQLRLNPNQPQPPCAYLLLKVLYTAAASLGSSCCSSRRQRWGEGVSADTSCCRHT